MPAGRGYGTFSASDNTWSHTAIDVRVDCLSYVVSEKPAQLWQRLVALQMPWETSATVRKQVLQDVSFSVNSGTMLAILGSSGSGKTSLLDVITCRAPSPEGVTGEVYLNGVARTRSMVDACSAYVRQDDRLLPNLTVQETLLFVAQLKLPTTFTESEVLDRVSSVIAELGLSHVSDTRVGNSEMRGLSGGERRRVSIGIQLLLDPSVLFLDEPTSGLDSFTAHHLVETLARLAHNGRTVILSIHQPRSDLLDLFDKVLLMSKGQMVYFGEARNMVDYFNSLGFPCPELTNPCDYYVDLSTVDSTSEASDEFTSHIVEELVSAFQLYNNTLVQTPETDTQEKKHPDFDIIAAAFKGSSNHPGVFRQFSVLFRRAMRNLLEDYAMLIIHFLQALTMSFILGVIFVQLGEDQLAMRDRFGLMYLLSTMYPYMVILDIIGQGHQERKFLYFEMQDNIYGPGPFFFAKIASELPFHTIYHSVYITPMYFLAGLPADTTTFFTVYGLIYISVFCSRALAMFCAAFMPTFQMAVVFSNVIFTLQVMSSGFLITLDNLMSAFRWVSTVSYIRWGFEGTALATISNLNFTCDGTPPQFCVHTGREAMEIFGFGDGTMLQACTAIGATIVVFLILFFCSLKWIPQKPHEH
ncbi:ATP-binding cassette sub-family G member 8-like isoform X2 [Gigantopelta aegis]|uniref:ATP-binding cassette sub-family G member 8-like isoform X2 n=1 Tax=Gigantopelta aegis TaxID=1735272 RepID=UPI001B88BC28|nr:ATP-binding cassette sub-family G member 8-like isoform X2 [Gigantopelta aegis]